MATTAGVLYDGGGAYKKNSGVDPWRLLHIYTLYTHVGVPKFTGAVVII